MKNKKELVWWSTAFNDLILEWLKNNNPDIIDNFINLKFLEKNVYLFMGYNSRLHTLTGLSDRKHKTQFIYNQTSDCEWLPYQEYPKQSFTDCMLGAAQSIASVGKTIDLFWSGGLDSNAILIAFNELGLHKQLRIIIGGPPESPTLFDKLIKGRIDYIIDQTSTLTNTFGLAKPDEHVWTGGVEADILFGAKANLQSKGINVKDYSERCSLWNTKRRYGYTRRMFRMIVYCNIDWVDINNHKSFYTHPSIEKFVINQTLSGEMVFYDLTDENWDNQWQSTIGYDKSAEGQKHYLSCKMPLRDFIYSFTKDDSISYKMPKITSETRLRFQKPSTGSFTSFVRKHMPPPRNIAVTDEGVVITRDNFLDYDWLEYINVQ